MERERSKTTLFMFFFASVLVSQNLVIPVMCRSFEDQKNYYSPDPHVPSTPSGSHGHQHGSHSHGSSSPSPSHGSGRGSTPSHGRSGNCGTPPSHGSYTPTPSTPTPSTPSHGGGYYHSPPTTPTPSTPTPSTPSDGGGYYHSPPTTPTPVTPVPVTPTPDIVTPPSTPFITPTTPSLPNFPTPPLTPFLPDPNSPPPFLPGTCNYWRTHPDVILSLLGWWGTIGGIFGVSSTPTLGTSLSLIEALSNMRTDGIGALYREGTASFLNSIANRRFPLSTGEVRNRFSEGLVSNKAATAQAQVFKRANEGRLKPRA